MNNILRFIFPERSDEARIREVMPSSMHMCYEPLHLRNVTALSFFRDPLVRACIHEIKYHNNEKGAELLGALLSEWTEANVTEPALLIPVPLAGKRFRERGYNQVERIARYACDASPLLTLDTRALVRIRETKPQTSLAKHARRENVDGAFAVRRSARARLQGARVVLLDDVTTTGATVAAAKAALLPHRPSSITCITLAH